MGHKEVPGTNFEIMMLEELQRRNYTQSTVNRPQSKVPRHAHQNKNSGLARRGTSDWVIAFLAGSLDSVHSDRPCDQVEHG